LLDVAVKPVTPPEGVTTVDVGVEGRLVAGPRTPVGSGASQMGLISDAEGAATDPAIWGVGGAACAGFTTPARVGTSATRIADDPKVRARLGRDAASQLPALSTPAHRRRVRDLEENLH
jgi:hypothetical protein